MPQPSGSSSSSSSRSNHNNNSTNHHDDSHGDDNASSGSTPAQSERELLCDLCAETPVWDRPMALFTHSTDAATEAVRAAAFRTARQQLRMDEVWLGLARARKEYARWGVPPAVRWELVELYEALPPDALVIGNGPDGERRFAGRIWDKWTDGLVLGT